MPIVHIDGTYDFTKALLCYSRFVDTVHDRWQYTLLVQAKTNALRYTLGCEPLPQNRKIYLGRLEATVDCVNLLCSVANDHSQVGCFGNHRQTC